MLGNFLLTETLEGVGVDSTVAWARHPTGRVLVFVNGFGGRAVATWSSFLSLLSREPRLAGWDLVFYGYDGLHTRAVASAGLFRQFLAELQASPQRMYERSQAVASARGQHPPAYSSIVIAAHSLGAVVARRALVDLWRAPETRHVADLARLLLFAPAHRGATLRRWAQASPMGVLDGLLPLMHLLGRFAVLDDLEIGSPTLQDLAADLLAYHRAPRAAGLRARAVFHAEHERIVELGDLPPDGPAVILNGVDHNSICKPEGDRRQALDGLLAHL